MKAVKTALPGPRSKEWIAKKERYVPRAFAALAPFIVAKGEGAVVWDLDGNRFLDFTGGWGCLAVGYSHPRVVAAVKEQAERFLHTDFTAMMYEPFIALAERLSALAPGPTPKKAAFFNSGAEAVENAVKIARFYTKRKAVVVFEGAFHGRTLLAMTMTHKAKPYKAGFGPLAPEVYRIPFVNEYRCDLPFAEVERKLVSLVAPEDVAALVVEPIQGEGGFVVPKEGFLQFLRELTERYGIVLVADEIQAGLGRTGHSFACEHFGLEPDLICLGKSLAAGLPLTAVVGKAAIMDSVPEGGIGGTFAGNPLACRVALEVLEIIEEEGLLQRAEELGQQILDRFRKMQQRFDLIGDVRGLGAMVAMELVKDRATKEPAAAETSAIIREAIQNGLVLAKAGLYGNVIRMLLPLVTPEEQLEEGLNILESAIASVVR
ncbi:MAG: 4-aminobutyrate--2-oxoglutarate transaminase [Candidatus Acetothermia bacterium]|jgi:4-aminobutyrate aminotransferase/(S)-3-amino-2-methylpropionate transaminase|nr:4-aminobutyrate--2-oxoglutarate transaminase [Candidatus Acetothermia bacterium]MDH7505511.1 4-aminobutyrate--2-oxoglutarate transaminase [Candidatus Acetothermia bacterium]